MAAALFVLVVLALATMLIGLVTMIVAIRNAPEAIETEKGLEITRAAHEVRREADGDAPEDEAKLHGRNPQFS